MGDYGWSMDFGTSQGSDIEAARSLQINDVFFNLVSKEVISRDHEGGFALAHSSMVPASPSYEEL